MEYHNMQSYLPINTSSNRPSQSNNKSNLDIENNTRNNVSLSDSNIVPNFLSVEEVDIELNSLQSFLPATQLTSFNTQLPTSVEQTNTKTSSNLSKEKPNVIFQNITQNKKPNAEHIKYWIPNSKQANKKKHEIVIRLTTPLNNTCQILIPSTWSKPITTSQPIISTDTQRIFTQNKKYIYILIPSQHITKKQAPHP